MKTNTIHNEDCISGMKKYIPDASIDMVLTSPPYGNLRDYKGYEFDYKKIGHELFRILKEGSVVVWVVGDQTIDGSETGESFRQALYFKDIGFNLLDTMIYAKDSAFQVFKDRYKPMFEYMFVFSKGRPRVVNLIKDRKNITPEINNHSTIRNKNGVVQKKKPYEIKEYGVRGNTWQYQTGYMKSSTDKIAFKHPAIFPEALAKDHIISWSNPDDIILDPMMGSGTTAKAAKFLGRQYIGFEVSAEYCAIAEERLRQEVLL